MPFGAVLGGIGAAVGIAGGVNNLVNSGPSDAQNAATQQNADLTNAEIAQINKNQSYMDALAQGETNPQYAQRVGEQEGRLRGDLIDSMKETINQNRRNLAQGGPGLFANQDRRDEAVSQALNKGFEGARTNAENLVNSDYATAGHGTLQGAEALGGAANQSANLAKILGNENQQALQNQNQGFNALGTGINGIVQAFQGNTDNSNQDNSDYLSGLVDSSG